MADARHTRSAQTPPAGLRRALLWACLLGAWLVAAPAWSAELVQVRVGNHPTFTRVVFEFDAAAGYRIERHAAGEADNTIVVTLDASTRARDIASRSPGVERVSVEAGSGNAVARILTRKPGLPIKEMILSNPPRVVLDLMLPFAAPARADEIEPAAAVAIPEPESEPVPVAEPQLADSEPPSAPVEPAPVAPAPVEPVPVEPAPVASEPMSVAVEPEPVSVVVVPIPVPEAPSPESEFEPDVIAEPEVAATEPEADELS